MKNKIPLFDWDSAPEILKVREMAILLRIDKMTAYELCRSEGFPSFKLNTAIRIHKKGLLKWIEEQYDNED